MPQIKEYNQQVSSPGPINTQQATAEDFGLGVAQGLAQAGQGVQEATSLIHQQEQRSESVQVGVDNADRINKYDESIQDLVRNAKPGDKISEGLLEEFDRDADTARSKINTPGALNYFEASNARLKSHISHTLMAAQAELEGKWAVQGKQTEVNKYSSQLARDGGSSFNLAIAQMKDSWDNETAIKGGSKAQLQEKDNKILAISAIEGAARLNVDHAEKWLNSTTMDPYLNGEDKEKLQNKIDALRRAKEINDQRKDRLAAKALKEAQNGVISKMLEKVFVGDGQDPEDVFAGKVTGDDNTKPVQLEPQQITSLMHIIQHKDSDAMQTDKNSVVMDLKERIGLPYGDPRKITDDSELLPFVGNGLSARTRDWMAGMINDKKTEGGREDEKALSSFLKLAQVQMGAAGLGKTDADAMKRYITFEGWARTEFKARKNAGVSMHDMLTPPKDGEKPNGNYLGNEMDMPRYRPQIDSAPLSFHRQTEEIPGPFQGDDEKHPPYKITDQNGKTWTYYWDAKLRGYQ